MQHIKADLKKWSATLKRVYDCPKSELNQYQLKQAAHSLYRGQINKKGFTNEHCWEILGECPLFMRAIGSKTTPSDNTTYVTPPRRSSHSSTPLEESNEPLSVPIEEENIAGEDVQGGDDLLMRTPSHDNADASIRSSNDPSQHDVGDENQSPPLRARPLGRKATKHAKRQASIEAQSALGERVAKSFEDIHTSNSVGWQKTTDIQEREKQAMVKKIKMQALLGRMAMEKEAMIIEKFMLDVDPTALGSLSEKTRVLIERKRKIADLQAQTDALLHINTSLGPSTSSVPIRNLQIRFDEEAIG